MTEPAALVEDDPLAHRPPTRPANAKTLPYAVSWRCDPTEWAYWQAFFGAFEDGRMATAMRWLTEQPEVRELVSKRIREGIS